MNAYSVGQGRPLLLVRCGCGGSLREIDDRRGGWLRTQYAACNRCGVRYAWDDALRAADDAQQHLEVVVLARRAS